MTREAVTHATAGNRPAAGSAPVTPLPVADDSETRIERFVTLAAEGRPTAEIAKACGYTEGTIRVYRSRHRDRIRQACEELLASDVPGLLAGLKEMAENKDTPANVRLQAHRDLLDRAGMAGVTRVAVTSEHERLVELCGGNPETAKAVLDALRKLLPTPEAKDTYHD